MESKVRAILDARMPGGRPPYESPRVLSLSDLRSGVGGTCEGCCYPHGSGAKPWCITGIGDGDLCNAGSSAGCCLNGTNGAAP